MEKLVQIEYWQQETMESGGWRRTDFMPIESAQRLIEQHWYEQASIVEPSTISEEAEIAKAFDKWVDTYSKADGPGVQEAIDFANKHQGSAGEWSVAYVWYLFAQKHKIKEKME